ncbi:MAG TPA: two-component system response regulator [Firmicutes bacterium]|jgi:two-component system, chemotaxis family, chemotaxis protein CheY|nr:two-component system response regulator [Bacillota bacterium]
MGNRILIVDDAMIIRMILTKILTMAGFQIAGEASTGAEGVRKYKEVRPDLVTMDITMPGMGGISALKAIREFDPQAKVVICSAMGQKALIMDAMQAGAINFIAKPFDEAKVIETISTALQMK